MIEIDPLDDVALARYYHLTLLLLFHAAPYLHLTCFFPPPSLPTTRSSLALPPLQLPHWLSANPRHLSFGADTSDEWIEVPGPGAMALFTPPSVAVAPQTAPFPSPERVGSVWEYCALTEWEWCAADVIQTVKRVEALHFQNRPKPESFPPTLTPRLTNMVCALCRGLNSFALLF